MPLSITRYNAQPSSHPNHLITFVKPLPGPDASVAETYLHAIAAICLPIMKAHHLSVTTLEEHEPNREFIGRNFNNGEIIQLVLKTRGGAWMPFRHVQMVMMHELAHNTHMNHGKGFWAERGKYAVDLKGLWAKGYTGDGFWGRGRTTDMQTIEASATIPQGDDAPLALCGGTYRSRRRRKRRKGNNDGGQELTWKEKRDRRIEKKFGKNGARLGEDDGARMLLEIGKTVGSGKPRVANSKRGRELRAAAALARFGQQAKQEEDSSVKSEGEEDSEEFESDEDRSSVGNDDARDAKGQRMLDSMGFGMVRVCKDENDADDDIQVKQEMDELQALDHDTPSQASESSRIPSEEDSVPNKSLYSIPQHSEAISPRPSSSSTPLRSGKIAEPRHRTSKSALPASVVPKLPPPSSKADQTPLPANAASHVQSDPGLSDTSDPHARVCPICTLAQSPQVSLLTCMACSHVLEPRKDPRSWVCACSLPNGGPDNNLEHARYVNAGDVGVCGLCGRTKDSTCILACPSTIGADG